MTLRIETFSNVTGGNSFYKAIAHPLAARRAGPLLDGLAAAGRTAIYDPYNLAEGFAALYDLARLDLAAVLVQDVESVGRVVLGRRTRPVTALPELRGVARLLVVAFDADRPIEQIRHLLPPGAEAVGLDAIRLPDDMLSNRKRYLDPLNFATNFAFFRDADLPSPKRSRFGFAQAGGHHTRLATVNYWAGYGADAAALWACLFDDAGAAIAVRQALPARSAAYDRRGGCAADSTCRRSPASFFSTSSASPDTTS
jgi:hypothetical protein